MQLAFDRTIHEPFSTTLVGGSPSLNFQFDFFSLPSRWLTSHGANRHTAGSVLQGLSDNHEDLRRCRAYMQAWCCSYDVVGLD